MEGGWLMPVMERCPGKGGCRLLGLNDISSFRFFFFLLESIILALFMNHDDEHSCVDSFY